MGMNGEANSGQGSANTVFPRRISPYLKDLIARDPAGPVARQFEPSAEEGFVCPCENPDPLGEGYSSPVPRLVHRYRDRVLVLVTGRCAAYCRYCFRRSETTSRLPALDEREIGPMIDYLADHPEVHEILFSGGDPLTLSNEDLMKILSRFRQQSSGRVFRIGTRMPIADPQRIHGELISGLSSVGPVWIVVQCNHRDELTKEAADALGLFIRGGIPVVSQTVLLKGVNDSVQVLKDLFHRLVELGVKPYYLFQGDLAPGTSHFRVPLAKGIALVTELRTHISGLSMPVYAVDLPDGGGKIPLTESYFMEETKEVFRFRSIDGTIHDYPKEGGS
ncbi:MAG: KamA family radical SAM protein [Spirochaetales bacterium]|nr:KamA family radical SAM protein [Spirochaetales bacterium]